MASRFHESTPVKMSEVGGLREAALQDTFEDKLELIAGAYRHHDGLPWVPTAVREAEKELHREDPGDHQYMYSLGDQTYRMYASQLVLGPDSPALLEGRVVCAQSLGGGGAISMGARYLSQNLKYTTVYFSSPTWFNHAPLFLTSGFSEVRHYRYWSDSRRGLDFEGMIQDLRDAPQDSVIVLQGCAHNPTGMDLSREQWRRVADVVLERKLLPFLDNAYQGFASGDLDADAWQVRHFVQRGIELLYAQSFSKNMGLYDERVGSLIIVANDAACTSDIAARLENLERSMYVAMPRHGCDIVVKLLQNDKLRTLWNKDIAIMAARVKEVRKELRRCLEDIGTPGTWSHITEQTGMFSYTGLLPEDVKRMIEDYHIYMMSSGRINMCGVTSKNARYVARAIRDCILRRSSNGTDHCNGNGTSAAHKRD